MINFIHIPKVAGCSMYKLAYGVDINLPIKGNSDIMNYYGHIRAMDIPLLSPSFCFVRNPYDRLVGTYFYLLDDHANDEPDISYKEILLKYADFKDFVMNIEKDRLNKAIIHVKPMSYYICDDFGNILVDRVFKIENIEEIDDYLQEIGIIGKLSDTFRNNSRHDHYSNYMDEDVEKEIERLYALDFELFNYKKEH